MDYQYSAETTWLSTLEKHEVVSWKKKQLGFNYTFKLIFY